MYVVFPCDGVYMFCIHVCCFHISYVGDVDRNMIDAKLEKLNLQSARWKSGILYKERDKKDIYIYIYICIYI